MNTHVDKNAARLKGESDKETCTQSEPITAMPQDGVPDSSCLSCEDVSTAWISPSVPLSTSLLAARKLSSSTASVSRHYLVRSDWAFHTPPGQWDQEFEVGLRGGFRNDLLCRSNIHGDGLLAHDMLLTH